MNYFIEDIAEFARTKGAKDKKKRKRRGISQAFSNIKSDLSDRYQAYATPGKVKQRMTDRYEEYKRNEKGRPSIRKGMGRGLGYGAIGGSALGTLSVLKGGTLAGLPVAALAGGAAGGVLGGAYGLGDKLIRGGKYKRKRNELAKAQADDYLKRTKGGRRLRKDAKEIEKAYKKAANRYSV